MAIEQDQIQVKFFIALVPENPIFELVNNLKLEVKERFNSKASLNSPAHITLLMPFQFKLKKKELLVSFLKTFAEKQSPVEIIQSGFGCFEPRVIFLNVEKNLELENLQKNLMSEIRTLGLFNKNYKNRAYHPHMTIAFRDLKKQVFAEVWDYYKDQIFEQQWQAKELMLLQHDGKMWQVDHKFPLNSK